MTGIESLEKFIIFVKEKKLDDLTYAITLCYDKVSALHYFYNKDIFVVNANKLGSFYKKIDGDYMIVTVDKDFKLEFIIRREEVCVAKVVGKKVITKATPVAYTTEEKEVDIIEWDCPFLLKKEVS